MDHQRSPSRALVAAVAINTAVLLGLGVGCATFTPLLPGDMPQNAKGDSFANATPLVLDPLGSATIGGSITSNKAAVFDLGPISPGDRIIVSVEPATGSALDPVIAVFDQNGELFALNDDVDFSAGLFGSALNDVAVSAGPHYYLAIAKFSFDLQGGAYDGTVRIERGGVVPTPPIQVLLLNFAGGTITIQSEGTLNLNTFDAADIDPVYAGQTAVIKSRITDVVKENFSATGVQIVTSDQNPSLTPGTFSTIHFGSFSPTKFGVSDGVDEGNTDCCDDGIVFTHKFDDPFATQPSVDGIAVAIGNVAAHEAGHLLGLNHVSDFIALMDNTGTASTLLANQNFKTAPLSPSVFPLGMQNAPAILNRVVPAP